MNFEVYQDSAFRTAADSGDWNRDTLITALGLAGEVGEVVELVKKHIGHGRQADLVHLQAELGDVLWYVADLATRYGLNLNTVAANNIGKLRERYPQGFHPHIKGE